MLAQQTVPASQVGEDRSSPFASAPIVTYSVNQPEPDADSLNDLVFDNDWLRPGDVVYVTETRRHILTENDLNAAARALIGGAA